MKILKNCVNCKYFNEKDHWPNNGFRCTHPLAAFENSANDITYLQTCEFMRYGLEEDFSPNHQFDDFSQIEICGAEAKFFELESKAQAQLDEEHEKNIDQIVKDPEAFEKWRAGIEEFCNS